MNFLQTSYELFYKLFTNFLQTFYKLFKISYKLQTNFL